MFYFRNNVNIRSVHSTEFIPTKTFSIGITSKSETPKVIQGFPTTGSNASMIAVDKAAHAIIHLSKLDRAHSEATILQMFGPTSRLKHFLFPLNDTVIKGLCAPASTLSELERIFGRPLPDNLTSIISLSIPVGGLGFPLLGDIDSQAECSRALESVERIVAEDRA